MATMTCYAKEGAMRESSKPDLEFKGLVVSAPSERLRSMSRSSQVAVSILLHALIIGSLVIVPLLTESSLPEPARAVRTYFVAPSIAPPPPPPPASTAKAPAPIASVTEPRDAHEFTAPAQISSAVEAWDGLDLGNEGGIQGGVEGGAAEGVVGAIVGGVFEAKLVDTPRPVGGEILEPRKVRHVDPLYPRVAKASRIQGVVVIECVIGRDGQVDNAKVVHGVPLLDDAALDAVRLWRYRPTLLQGVPIPVVMKVIVSFRLT